MLYFCAVRSTALASRVAVVRIGSAWTNVSDWDAFMVPAAALAGWEITQHPDTWPAYQQRVGTVLDAAAQAMFRLWQYSHCGVRHERDQRLSSGRWPSAVI